MSSVSQPFSDLYAASYDAFYAGKDYAGEVELLEGILREAGLPAAARVLDLGCGTGSHSRELVRRGHEVVGLDRSPEMLEQARAKVPEAEFVLGDVSGFDLPGRFDLALLMFAVLGYQTDDEQVRGTLGSVARHLRPGGLLAFDVWYSPAVEAIGPGPRRHEATLPDGRALTRAATPELLGGGRCRVHYDVELRDGAEVVQSTSEDHVVRAFDVPELEAFLGEAGLKLLRASAFPEVEREPGPDTWNVILVARSEA